MKPIERILAEATPDAPGTGAPGAPAMSRGQRPPLTPGGGAYARGILLRGAAFSLLWWILAEGRIDGWGVGLVSVGLALAASLMLAPPGPGRLSPAGLLAFAGFFLVQSVKGGSQVAVRALRPRMDLAPALVELPVALPEGHARVLLVNTLNLLPGTVSVQLSGDTLRLHVLDARLPVAAEVNAAQAHIARLWREAP